jgi:arylsulfatase A-like enzyme
LLKVGLPRAKQGLQDKDPTIAELLKPHGYATAQIGKNHLGDRNEFLPTVHGFDEFYGMMELDDVVGRLLKKLDDLGIADNTIVVFTSDNGAETISWPDGGNTPFRGEKGTTWEGGFRVPCLARWPGVIKPGIVINEITSHEDWLPTFLAAAGDRERRAENVCGQERSLRSTNALPSRSSSSV